MKTTINTNTIKANRQHARDLERQARELRQQNQQLRLQIKAEEETILQTMVETVQDIGAFMTAREIVRAIGGTMSVHEVAGQLTWARNSRDSGRKPQPYFEPCRHNMTHKAMAQAAPLVEVEERKVTRCFAEVDEDGAIIPGGRTFKQTESRNIYHIGK